MKSNQMHQKIENHTQDSTSGTQNKKITRQNKIRKTNLFGRELGGIRKNKVDSELSRDGRRRSRTRSHERERSFRRINSGDRLLPGSNKRIVS